MANGTLVRCLLLAIFGLSLLGQSGRAADIEVGDTVIIKAEAKPLKGGLRSEFVSTLPWGIVQQVTEAHVTLQGVRFSRQDVVHYADAKDYFTKDLENNPQSVATLVRRGITTLKSSNQETRLSGINDLKAAIEKEPENGTLYQVLCVLLSSTNEIDEAMAKANKAVELAPNDASSFFVRAYIFSLKGEPQQSYDDANKAIELNPDSFESYIMRGVALEELGRGDEALKDFTTLLRKDYNFAQAFENRAETLRKKNDLAGAYRDAKEAVRLNPKSYSALKVLAQTITSDHEEKLSVLERAIALNPQASDAYTLRGIEYSNRFDFTKAKADFDKASSLSPEVFWTVQWQLEIAELQENPAKAIEILNNFLKNQPDNIDALIHRSKRNFEQKQYDLAIADISLVLSKRPNDAPGYYARGKCYFAKGDIDAARKDFDTGLAEASLNPELLTERGKIFLAEKEYSKAIEYFDKALGVDPISIEAMQGRADANAGKGNQVSEALDRLKLETYRTALINRELRLGYIAYVKQDYFTSYKHYHEILTLNDKDHRAYQGLGSLYMQGKLWQKSKEAYSKVIELTPRNADAYAARANLVMYLTRDVNNGLEDYSLAVKFSDSKNRAKYLLVRSNIYDHLKDYDKQAADIRSAFKLAPFDDQVLNSLAWHLATCPSDKHRDGKQAVKLATKACEITEWKDWKIVDTLAAAYAEAGDTENAVKTQEQAIELGGVAANVPRTKSRLELFRSGKAYREDAAAMVEAEQDAPQENPVPPQDE
ncbi:MAG: tetratricopeptide repeat protein [Planctomycetaceae bacterium]